MSVDQDSRQVSYLQTLFVFICLFILHTDQVLQKYTT